MPICELGPDDVGDVVAVWEACDLTRPWNDPVADAERALAGSTSTILGLRSEGELIGTVMVGTDGHRGWVYYLAVAPEHRRAGHGRALLTSAEDWLAERGTPKVQLMVRSTNRAVVDFYTALGYGDQEAIVLGRFLDPDRQRLREEHQHAG